jgi:nicotinamidase-related amidase
MPLLKEGSGKNNSSVALLLIDVINDLDFDRADELMATALPMARKIATLKREAAQLQIPSVYVNDNFGQWQSDFRHTVEHCCAGNSRGREISRALRPEVSDYFVLKPKHSGFYATTLDVLLEYLKVDTLIITGIAANICVLFTANDAYMRDYDLIIPSDCTASNSAEENREALALMRKFLKADTRPSSKLRLPSGRRKKRRAR